MRQSDMTSLLLLWLCVFAPSCHALDRLMMAMQVDAVQSDVISNGDLTKKDIAGNCQPVEVHLSLGDENYSMHVMWRTTAQGCPSKVSFGLKSQRSQAAASPNGNGTDSGLRLMLGSSYQITEDNMCSAPAKHSKFRAIMHVVKLCDLEPEEEYWYQVEGDDREFSFRAPPTPSPKRSMSFIAFGDMGEAEVKARKCGMAAKTLDVIQDEMERQPVDMILHMGDLAYADGKNKVWESFMRAIEPVASRVPYMVGVGNHEYDYTEGHENDPSGSTPYHPEWGNFGAESGGECGAMTAMRFAMPTVEEDNSPFWYSFAYGMVKFVIISTEHDLSPGSTQYRWLERTLAGVDRCTTPWLVVGLHRPMYVVYPHKDNRVVGEHLRDYIEGLLIEYRVDLTIAGHVHTYYRTCAVRGERCSSDGSGISHFIIGTGGHELSGITDEQKDWVAAGLNEHGFVRFDVHGHHMRALFISSDSGEVLDETELVARVYADDECDALAEQRKQRLQQLMANSTGSGSSRVVGAGGSSSSGITGTGSSRGAVDASAASGLSGSSSSASSTSNTASHILSSRKVQLGQGKQGSVGAAVAAAMAGVAES